MGKLQHSKDLMHEMNLRQQKIKTISDLISQ